jgi:hypothetical protein
MIDEMKFTGTNRQVKALDKMQTKEETNTTIIKQFRVVESLSVEGDRARLSAQERPTSYMSIDDPSSLNTCALSPRQERPTSFMSLDDPSVLKKNELYSMINTLSCDMKTPSEHIEER